MNVLRSLCKESLV